MGNPENHKIPQGLHAFSKTKVKAFEKLALEFCKTNLLDFQCSRMKLAGFSADDIHPYLTGFTDGFLIACLLIESGQLNIQVFNDISGENDDSN